MVLENIVNLACAQIIHPLADYISHLYYMQYIYIYIVVCITDGSNGKALLGTLDYAWLFSYALAMFFR